MLIWSNTYLDRRWAKLLAFHENLTVHIKRIDKFGELWCLFARFGDYFIELYLPRDIHESFEYIFSSMDTSQKYEQDLLRATCEQRSTYRITVHHNPTRANEMKLLLVI